MTIEHDEMALLVPAYLRNELTAAERIDFERYRAENPTFEEEIAFQKAIKDAVGEDNSQGQVDELGWARLSSQMKKERATAMPAKARPNYWRVAAASLSILVVAQAALIGGQYLGAPEDRYTPVTQVAAQSPTMKVGFQPAATEFALRALLQSVKGDIVSGPSALGFYEVAFSQASDCRLASEVFAAAVSVVKTKSDCE